MNFVKKEWTFGKWYMYVYVTFKISLVLSGYISSINKIYHLIITLLIIIH